MSPYDSPLMGSRPEPLPIPPGYQAASSHLFDEEGTSDVLVEARRAAGHPDELTVATWNVEWAPARKRDAICQRLVSLDADVIVLTEGDRGVLPEGGYCIDGGMDWGYQVPDPARRKVILWSKHELHRPEYAAPGDTPMPPGRFASATVLTARGAIRFMAVCIPWKDAHVRTGRRNAAPWEEHVAYLRAAGVAFRRARFSGHGCVIGDFNQRIPRRASSPEAYAELTASLRGFRVATEGVAPGLDEPVVDHIAVTSGIDVTSVHGIDRHDRQDAARPLSDHHLVVCRMHVASDSYG